jgi:hypothetical protein
VVPRVILEGPFYSPNASEGRWAYNVGRLLHKLHENEEIELDLYLPKSALDQYYYKEYDCWNHFSNTKLIHEPMQPREYDVHFLLQASLDKGIHYLNDSVIAKKKVLGNFELYWYGPRLDAATNIPESAVYAHAMIPYTKDPTHQKWPTNRPYHHIPFACHYEPESNNFENKGILLCIKSPCVSELSDATIHQKMEHFDLAIRALSKGYKVTVGYANRLLVGCKPNWGKHLLETIEELKDGGATFVGNVPPHLMGELIKEHSVVLTGKVDGTNFYGSFMDALCYGSVPVIWHDWPEQFFRTIGTYGFKVFPHYSTTNLAKEVESLLESPEVYANTLNRLREHINLYTEQDGLNILRKIINE